MGFHLISKVNIVLCLFLFLTGCTWLPDLLSLVDSRPRHFQVLPSCPLTPHGKTLIKAPYSFNWPKGLQAFKEPHLWAVTASAVINAHLCQAITAEGTLGYSRVGLWAEPAFPFSPIQAASNHRLQGEVEEEQCGLRLKNEELIFILDWKHSLYWFGTSG